LDDQGVFCKVGCTGQWKSTRRIPPAAPQLLAEFEAAGFDVLWREIVPPVHETDVEMLQTRCRRV
jgi:hypothetical protein